MPILRAYGVFLEKDIVSLILDTRAPHVTRPLLSLLGKRKHEDLIKMRIKRNLNMRVKGTNLEYLFISAQE